MLRTTKGLALHTQKKSYNWDYEKKRGRKESREERREGWDETQRKQKGGVKKGREGIGMLVRADKEITVPSVTVVAKFSCVFR